MKKSISCPIVLILSFVLYSGKALAQNKDTLMSAQNMKADFNLYKTVLKEAHAGLNLYITRAELDDEFKKVAVAIEKPLYKNQFYLLLLKTTASLKHGHSFLVNDQAYGINYTLRDLVPDKTYLPFTLKIIDGKVYVGTDCTSKEKLKPGVQILSINGISIDALLTQFQAYIPADGGNTGYKNFKLQNFLFQYLYRLLYPSYTRYKIKARSVYGKLAVFEVDGITPEILERNYQLQTGRSANYFPIALQYKVIDMNRSVGYLKVFSFYEGLTNRNGVEFNRFMDSTFHRIADEGIKKLIVDLRDNEGGNDYLATVLFSYLTNKTFSQGNPTYLQSDTISFLDHIKDPEEDVKQFTQHPAMFEDKVSGKFILKKQFDEFSYQVFSPKEPSYTGKLIILTNGGSFSATSRFINLVDHYLCNEKRVVKFISENYGGDNSKGFATEGGAINVILPNSHFRLTVPIMERTRLLSKKRDANGILDKKIEQDPKRILEDTQLKKAIDYARSL